MEHGHREGAALSGRDTHVSGEPARLAVQHHRIDAGPQAQLYRMTLRLVQLDGKRAMIIAEVQSSPDILRDDEAGSRGSEIGQHEITGPCEIDVVCRMLGAVLGLLCRGERLLERICIGLVERHHAVARRIRRAAQTRYQEVREK